MFDFIFYIESFFSIDNVNIKEIWTIANTKANERLQEVCVPKIANAFDSLSVDQDILSHTTVSGLKLLLCSDQLRNVGIKSKLNAIATWIISAKSSEMKSIRET